MRTDFVLFFVDDAVVVASLAGSLVGNLLPRLMLHERGVSPSSVKFAKTEANKPYICTVRHLLSLPVRGSTGCDKWEPYFFFFYYLLAKRTINTTRTGMCFASLTR